MSTTLNAAANATATAATAPISPPPISIPTYLTSLGLGYSIAIALGFLILISTLILSSYICCRASRLHFSTASTVSNASNANDASSIILPRILFVAEEEDDDLESNQNDVVSSGLDQEIINSYPKFNFCDQEIYGEEEEDSICSICLSEYKEKEILRMMPECKHCFHVNCVDSWLKLNGSCPVCRNSPLPTPQLTPLSTPLSEVVPLSQYSHDRRRTTRS